MTLRAADPPGCGCTDCITGWSVPLNQASSSQIADLLDGHLIDRTGVDLTVTVTATWEHLTWTLPAPPAA